MPHCQGKLCRDSVVAAKSLRSCVDIGEAEEVDEDRGEQSCDSVFFVPLNAEYLNDAARASVDVQPTCINPTTDAHIGSLEVEVGKLDLKEMNLSPLPCVCIGKSSPLPCPSYSLNFAKITW